MSKDTTDLDEQILLALSKPYLHERAEAVEQLVSNREKLARIDEQERYLKMLESGKWRSFGIEVTERLATLRKELDGGQSDE